MVAAETIEGGGGNYSREKTIRGNTVRAYCPNIYTVPLSLKSATVITPSSLSSQCLKAIMDMSMSFYPIFFAILYLFV